MKNKLVILGVVLVLLLSSFILFRVLSRDSASADDKPGDEDVKDLLIRTVNMIPSDDSSFGISKETSFEMNTEGVFSEEEIKSSLKFEPVVNFEVIKKSEQVFEVKPIEPLLSNTVYAVTYEAVDYGQAFQVAEDIEVYQSYPGNKEKNLPSTTAIELRFNTVIDEEIEKYFTIEPAVEGSFDYNESTLVFMPKSLKVNETYTVTLEAGYSLENRKMEETYAFSFETGYRDNFNSSITYNIKNAISQEAPIISINSWENASSYQVKVYNGLDFDNFNSMYQEFLSSKSSLDEIMLPEVFNSSVKPLVHENKQFVELPKLNDGYYIVKIQSKEADQYVFLQIGPHDIYYNENTKGNLLWLVDKTTGDLVKGAEIYINQEAVGVTDDQGIYLGKSVEKIKEVMISTENHNYLVNHIGEYDYYDFFGYNYSGNQWSFLYSDRNAYQKDDQIEIFGFAKYYQNETPKDLTLELKSYFEDLPLQSKAVVLDQDNSFSSSFEISGYDYGYYHVVLLDGETILSTTTMLVSNYEKPEILLDISATPTVLFSGENVEVAIKANYFNDLPYEGMKVQLNFDESKLNRALETDKNGQINFEFNPKSDVNLWRPESYSINVNSIGVENNYISVDSRLDVFSRDLMLTGQTKVLENKVEVVVESNQIDLSNYVAGTYDSIKGDQLSKNVTATIIESYNEKIFVAKIYDPIHKVSYDKYDYKKRQRALDPIYLNTIKGVGKFSFPTLEGRSYEINLSTEDSKGELVEERINVYADSRFWVDYSSMYELESSDDTYIVGDKVNKAILKYGEKFVAGKDQFVLALFLRNGLLDYKLIQGNEIDFDFVDAFRPNVLLKAVFFDGKQIQILPKYGHCLIGFDYESLEGEIEVKDLKTDYLPGEEITFNLKVKDALRQPFNGIVNVSVVDEAFFALYEDYFDLGQTLHQYVYYDGILSESTSADADANMDGAEAGGGGGDEGYIREDFVDTAYFKNIEIKNGLGFVTMNLPDNLTKFRITLQGVNGNLEYASKKIGFNISLPYFIRHFYNMNYLEGDEVYLPVSVEGKELTEDTLSKYSLYLDNQLLDTFDSRGKAMIQVPIGFVNKDVSVKITANAGDNFDGVVHDLKVNPFYLEFDFMRSLSLDLQFSPINIYNSSKLGFINKQAKDFQEDIYGSFSWDNVRLEEILARQQGKKLLNDNFDIDFDETYDLSNYQGNRGGLKLLPTSDEDIETTALIAATQYGVKNFDIKSMIYYLKNVLEDTSTPENLKALSLWGLAAQGEPVLLGVNEFLKTYAFDDLSLDTKLYIIYALLEMKDISRVKLMTSDFFDANGIVNLGTDIYILAAALDERLGLNSDKFSIFDVDDAKSKDTINLQKIYFLSQKTFDFTKTKLSYELKGEKTQVILDGLEAHVIKVNKGDVFKVTSTSENVFVTEQYKVNGLDEAKYKSDNLRMTKKYDLKNIKVGDLVPVVLSFDKPREAYITLEDQVPAGFEYAGYQPYYGSDLGFYVEQVNQSIRIRYFSEPDTGQVTYYIRAIQKGKYKAEPAAIYVYGFSELYMTKPEVLEVK